MPINISSNRLGISSNRLGEEPQETHGPQEPLRARAYSYRSASIGLRMAARYAGYSPNISPVPTAVENPTPTQNIETLAGRNGATVRIIIAIAPPATTPKIPPTAVRTI